MVEIWFPSYLRGKWSLFGEYEHKNYWHCLLVLLVGSVLKLKIAPCLSKFYFLSLYLFFIVASVSRPSFQPTPFWAHGTLYNQVENNSVILHFLVLNKKIPWFRSACTNLSEDVFSYSWEQVLGSQLSFSYIFSSDSFIFKIVVVFVLCWRWTGSFSNVCITWAT